MVYAAPEVQNTGQGKLHVSRDLKSFPSENQVFPRHWFFLSLRAGGLENEKGRDGCRIKREVDGTELNVEAEKEVSTSQKMD